MAKMANPTLPDEILLEIFIRIPSKSVGQCRTLSTSWNTQLSSTSFIKKHLCNQTIQQQNLALTSGKKLIIVTSPTKEDEAYKVGRADGCFYLVGSCNGLMLIQSEGMLSIVNPVTGKEVSMNYDDPLLITDSGFHMSSHVGFGYASCVDDYKIVVLSSYSPKITVDTKTFVDVYSVNSGEWKRLDDECYPYGGLVPISYACTYGAFMNGALHWLICSSVGLRSCIAAFDLANEVFHEIPLPNEFVRQLPCEDISSAYRKMRDSGFSVVGGCLLIVDDFGNGAADIWMMREYGVVESWVRFRLEAGDGKYKWDKILATLCYVHDGELLCLTDSGVMFACDPEGGTVRRVVLRGRRGARFRFDSGMAFVDSLVSPE